MQKQNYQATIVENRPVAAGFYQMRVAVADLTFAPGQFFMITVPGHSLRRAFAPSQSDARGFTFTYQLVGEGTRELSALPAGTAVEVLAPLGNGYDFRELNPCQHIPVLLGGGCGAPSLVLLGQALLKNGFTVKAIFGARTEKTLLSTAEMQANSLQFLAATDDGSCGFHGNSVAAAQALCEKIVNDGVLPVFFACGPRPMLKALAQWTGTAGYACQISLEERMGCGFGACMGCVVKVKAADGRDFIHARVCHDGPVFAAERIIWD